MIGESLPCSDYGSDQSLCPGDQERALAAKYRSMADALATAHPHTAAVLRAVAESYQRDGVEGDAERKLRLA